MTPVLMPVVEASLFTLGCMAIHALRRHADVVTATLACLATLLVLLIGAACAPEPYQRFDTASLGDYTITNPSLY